MTSTEREPDGRPGLVRRPPPPRATPQLSREPGRGRRGSSWPTAARRRDHHAGARRRAGRAQPDGALPLRRQQGRAGRPDGRPGVRAAQRGPAARAGGPPCAAWAAAAGTPCSGTPGSPGWPSAGRRWARTRSASTTPPWPSWSRSAWTRRPGWASCQPCSARSWARGWPCWRSRPCGPATGLATDADLDQRGRPLPASGSPRRAPTRTSPTGPPTPCATPPVPPLRADPGLAPRRPGQHPHPRRVSRLGPSLRSSATEVTPSSCMVRWNWAANSSRTRSTPGSPPAIRP